MSSKLITVCLVLLCSFYMSACAKENQTNNPFDVYKFPMKNSFVAISPLPGRVDLEADMKKIADNEITHVVTLVSQEELNKYNVPALLTRFDEAGIEVLHSPIQDYGLPEPEQMKSILTWLHKRVKSKQNVLVHCVGGLGRSGTVMAVYAKAYLGKSGEEAIQYVRSIRGQDAVETEQQQEFVINWE
ncbi:MAG: dual specificity protein phosphatase family protein [Crocinitomicaceae bacterium]|nr:dual specificity protein phosphatase family protein [Crocinitomicaceae bacterium]MBK8927201.1 dual specificity protein phosphatase family protein [Crocinitomicaceae bacterium]